MSLYTPAPIVESDMPLDRFFHQYAELSMGSEPEALASPIHVLARVTWGARFTLLWHQRFVRDRRRRDA